MNRLTTKIKGSNNYCEFELKNAKYKDLFELSSNREIEDYVNTDLTIAIDKLGQLEDIEEKYKISLDDLDRKLTVLEIIKKHKLLNYVLKNEKCANMYHLSKEEIDLLREIGNE